MSIIESNLTETEMTELLIPSSPVFYHEENLKQGQQQQDKIPKDILVKKEE